MDIFPAIDICNGRVVRLLQGDYQQMTEYALTPLEAAQRFEAQGAACLHVVDLDGAKDGVPANFAAIAAITSRTRMFVEVGGGVRDEARLCRYLQAGAGRVILGTAAVRDLDLVQRLAAGYGARLAVGVDARGGRVAVSGWRELTELDSVAFCEQLAARGVRTVIYTDIARDGALAGTNLEIYARLKQIAGLDIVASGGVSTLDEVRALARAGVAGVVVGKALYAGMLALPELLAAAKETSEKARRDEC